MRQRDEQRELHSQRVISDNDNCTRYVPSVPWNINLPDNRAETGPNDGALAFSRWEDSRLLALESPADEFKYLVPRGSSLVSLRTESLVNYEKQFDHERIERERERKRVFENESN